MTALLIVNTVVLSVALVSMLVLGVLLWKAEKKLAKYDESWMFKRK